MASITIYVAPKLKAQLKTLRARLERDGQSLSAWFEAQVVKDERSIVEPKKK